MYKTKKELAAALKQYCFLTDVDVNEDGDLEIVYDEFHSGHFLDADAYQIWEYYAPDETPEDELKGIYNETIDYYLDELWNQYNEIVAENSIL